MEHLEKVAQDYLNQKRTNGQFSPSTIRRKKAAFRQFATWNGTEILSKYKAPRAVPMMPHPIPGGIPNVLRMIEVARRDHQKALIALCGLCGLRVSEAISVTADDLEIGEFSQLSVFGKGYKTRFVPVSQDALSAILPAWAVASKVQGDRRIVPIGNRVARRTISSIGRRIGLQIASHDLRSTFATALYEESGYDLLLTQTILGHSDPATTRGYTHISPDRINQAVNFGKEK